MSKRIVDDNAIKYLRDHYADEDNSTIMETLGISRSTLCVWCKRLRLRKSADYLSALRSRIGKDRYEKLGPPIPITEEALLGRAESFKKTYRTEKCRIAWGLEQKTRLHVRTEPRAKTLQRSYLVKRGYIIDKAKNMALYTPETSRSPLLESPNYKHKKWYSFGPYNDFEYEKDC